MCNICVYAGRNEGEKADAVTLEQFGKPDNTNKSVDENKLIWLPVKAAPV